MATVAVAKTDFTSGYTRWEWSGLGNGDDGEGVVSSLFSDRSVQIQGDFDTGSTVVIEGSNDGGVTWFPLTDPQGNPISKTAAALEAVAEYTEMIRPRVTAGTASTNISAFLIGRRLR